MFEINMDEYLDEEVESLKQAFESIIRTWSKSNSNSPTSPTSSSSSPSNARFLGSHNPALVKRNLLASFTDVLLLPVTIAPRTVGAVGAALTTGGTAAAQGIAMLNPQRWGAGGAGAGGYSRVLGKDGGEDGNGNMLFDGGDEDGEDEFVNGVQETEKESSTIRCSYSPFSYSRILL